MNQIQTSAVVLAMAAVLCICTVTILSDGAEAAEEPLASTDLSSSPSGLFSLVTEYYADGRLHLTVVSPDGPDESGSYTPQTIGQSVLVEMYKGDKIQGTPLKSIYPVGMDKGGMYVVFELPAGEISEGGFYTVAVKYGDGGLIVRTLIWIDDDGAKIQIVESGTGKGSLSVRDFDGSLSGKTFTVPSGAYLSVNGKTLTVSWKQGDETQKYVVDATPAKGSTFGGWTIDNKAISGSVPILEDTRVKVVWNGESSTDPDTDEDDDPSPTPTPTPTPTPDPDVVPDKDDPNKGSKDTEFDDGGKTHEEYEKKDDGQWHIKNPVETTTNPDGTISDEQIDQIEKLIDKLKKELDGTGEVPNITVKPGTEGSTSVKLPARLLKDIVEAPGSLTVVIGNFTLFFSSNVLQEIGYSEDLEIVVIPVLITDPEEFDKDLSAIGEDPDVYEVYMARNGVRIDFATEFPNDLAYAIKVSIEYPLEGSQSSDRIHLWYVDPDPFEELDFDYADDSIHFDVYHLSHYAIAYDAQEHDDDSGWLVWFLGIVLLLLVLLLLFILLLAKRMKVTLIVEGGIISFIPDGWERETDDSISAKFRWHADLELPQMVVVPPENLEGHVIVGWDPEPPEKVTSNLELRCIWSTDVPPKLGDPERRT